MKINNRTFFLFITIVIIISGQCKNDDSPTKPPAIVLPDTTSHDFAWQVEILGDGNSSRLNDVCIIDENDVWAVGRICLQDSTGEFIYPPYGAARWNGSTWELKKLKTKALNYDTYLNPLGVFAFNPEDIWFAHGGIHHFNGQNINSYWVNWFPGNENAILDSGQSIDKIWGQSSLNLWAVGRQGAIIHYNGSSWQKIESGTDLDIQDIWGGTDPITGEDIILAVAGNIYTTYDKEILKINGTTVAKLTTEGIDWPLDAVWFDPGQIYYVVGAGIYSKKSLDNTVSWNGPGLTATSYSSYAIRGNYINDVFVTGAFGDVLHFNGNSWRSYREHTALLAGSYRAVAVKGDLMFAVGSEYDKAVILRGKRK